MRSRTRTSLLAGALVVVAGLVIFDQRSRGDDATSSADARFAKESSLVAEMEAALAQAGSWADAQASARDAFAAAAGRLLVGESEDIAFVRLREIVQANMTDLGLADGAASSLRPTTPLEGEPLREVGLRLEFETNDPAQVYRLVDRLENLPDVAASVEAITIVGPGRLGRSRAVVTLDVQALAWIGRGA